MGPGGAMYREYCAISPCGTPNLTLGPELARSEARCVRLGKNRYYWPADEERERGLMNRSSLGGSEGTVFLFDGATDTSFWLKDTLIPLSIAFWDGAGTIVGFRDMDTCTADPCPTYGSPEPYVGALEVNQG